jgi:hypothetical protein
MKLDSTPLDSYSVELFLPAEPFQTLITQICELPEPGCTQMPTGEWKCRSV